jgi:hypothetical protein
MQKRFRILGNLIFPVESKRTWPIKDGYRPGFMSINKMQTSGSINLIGRSELNRGEECVVEISFISKELLGEISSGQEIKFYEGANEIGSIVIISIIG